MCTLTRVLGLRPLHANMYIQYRSDARYKARVIYTSLHEEANTLVHFGKYMFIHSLIGLYKETNTFTREGKHICLISCI